MDLLLTAAFLCFLGAQLVLRYGLSWRHMRHVWAHRNAVPGPFARTISLQEHSKAAAYTVAKERMSMLELALDCALLLGWTLLGGLNAVNQAALALSAPLDQMLRGFTVLGQSLRFQDLGYIFILLAMVFSLTQLLHMPLAYYRQLHLEARFGFNRSSFGAWLVDQLKAFVLVLFLCLGGALILDTMGKFQSQFAGWWVLLWLVFLLLNLFFSWVVPKGIRLFNRLDPLPDGPLKQRIETLTQQAGFPVSGLFVMDGSRRSNHANAFFAGMGRSRSVVFFDTLLDTLTDDEVVAVLAHELGHCVHKHITLRLLGSNAMMLIFIAIFAYALNQVWFFMGLGVNPNLERSNLALGLVLFTLCAPVFGFFIGPLMAHFSRKWEFDADAYASQHSRAGDLASSLLKLTKHNASTLTPDPWYARAHYSHPPALERLAKLGAF